MAADIDWLRRIPWATPNEALMKRHSLSARLSRTLFFVIAATIIGSMVTVELFVKDIEDTILSLELKVDADYFKQQIRQGEFQHWKTGRLEAVFLPEGEPESRLPLAFQYRPVPFSEEVDVGAKTLLMNIEQTSRPPGRLFLAQDITIMENQEALVQFVLLAIAAGMLFLGLIVSRESARYLLTPLQRLTQGVQATEPGQSMQRLTADYRDREFEAIAEAFNRFLTALESHIEREKSFVKLASHELRTPLAVISGALDVLEQRQSLSQADHKTLTRIRNATRTMREDTEMLLLLARGKTNHDNVARVNVLQLVRETIDDLKQTNSEYIDRTTVSLEGPIPVVLSDPALIRTLLRNLLQNALRHTRSAVEVHVSQQHIRIRDFGSGLPPHVIEKLSATTSFSKPGQLQDSSFGLLIVQLACERLDWKLEVEQSDGQGTMFLVTMHGQKSWDV